MMTHLFLRTNKATTRKQTEISIPEIAQIMTAVKGKIRAQGSPKQCQALLRLIMHRESAFEWQIPLCTSKAEKQKFLGCYLHFAQTLDNFLDTPLDVHQTLTNYHHSTQYYHVSSTSQEDSYSFADTLVSHMLRISLSLLALSLLLLPFSLQMGLILLGTTLAILGPCLFYALTVTLPNERAVQQEEKEIFFAVQKLINHTNSDHCCSDQEGQAAHHYR